MSRRYPDIVAIDVDAAAPGQELPNYESQLEGLAAKISYRAGTETERGNQIEADQVWQVEFGTLLTLSATSRIRVTAGDFTGRTFNVVSHYPDRPPGGRNRSRAVCKEIAP